MRHALLVLIVALVASFPSPVLGQSSEELQALRKAVDALRAGQQRIERELGEIKALLRRPQAAAPDDEPKQLMLTIDGRVKGNRGARLVLVDFTDYQ